jgi:hypothetical protein
VTAEVEVAAVELVVVAAVELVVAAASVTAVWVVAGPGAREC